jgi:DNA-binding transcriptional LysR family regulator
MGPLALVGDELREGRLVAPIKEPAIRTRGYFVYAPEASSEAPAVTALRQWLVNAGNLADTEYPTYLASNRC